MKTTLDNWGPATVLMVGLTLIAALGGAVAVAIGHYTFNQYLTDLRTFAVGVGLLGIGRGVMTGLRDGADKLTLPGTGTLPHDSVDRVADQVAARLETRGGAQAPTQAADLPGDMR